MLDVLLFAAICLAKFGENIKQNMLFGMKSQFQAVLRQFQAVLGNFVLRPIFLPNLTANEHIICQPNIQFDR